MPQVARIGDLAHVVCPCHKSPYVGTATIITGSSDVFAEGSNVSYVGCLAKSGCGHITVIVSGSPNVITNGSNTARIGDIVSACPKGVIITGAGTVIANG